MSKVTAWVGVASELATELHGQKPSELRRRVLSFAEKSSLKPNTLQRMVKTFHYAAARIRSENMQISDISAAFTAVETLERLSRTSPETAARIGRAVLTGECSYREILSIYRNIGKEDGPNPDKFDWDEFLNSLYYQLFGSAPGLVISNPEKKGYSDLAKRLKVDIAFEIEGYQRAVFLAPTFPFSEGRSRPIEDHLARAFMSFAYYAQTVFIYTSQSEESTLQYFIGKCSQRFSRRILGQFSLYRYDFNSKAFSRAS